MLNKCRIYLLDPKMLDPETIAVTFAKTSRSPLSFREIADELTAEKSAEFHEKWVVGYGHASVAEHAVLHIAIENVSRLAVETIESNRLASYTEKSTRYQTWGKDDFAVPPELLHHPLASVYYQTCSHLFLAYQRALPALKAVAEQENPRLPDESTQSWDRRLRTIYVDVARYFLPAAALANVGMTINARALEHAITKMLSSPLKEVQEIGKDMKQVACAKVPTLIKYAEADSYLCNVRQALTETREAIPAVPSGATGWCRLIASDPQGEDQVLASALYRFAQSDYAHCLAFVRNLSAADRENLAKQVIGNPGAHGIPVRELEHTNYTFDLILDQGAYFELKRHRMMTQTPQLLTARLGYAMPRMIVTAGLETAFREAMAVAQETYEKIAVFNPEVAAYVVPNAFNRRVLLTLNLRAAHHLVRLRTAPNAHFAMRRVANCIAEYIRGVHPLLAGLLLSSERQEDWQKIEQRYFAQIM